MISFVNADALHIPLADETVQCVVTSPPYWSLRDYGVNGQLGLEATPEEYVAKMVAVFREVWRVCRKDAPVWLNLGDSYNGSGGAGGDYNSGGLKEGQPRYPGHRSPGLKPKDLCGIPWRVAFALQADGWWLRSDIIWAKPNPMPESVTDRPTKAHEYLFLLAKSQTYYYDAEAIREPHDQPWRGHGEKERINYNTGGIIGRGRVGEYEDGIKQYNPAGRNRRTVWTIPTSPYSGAHFATFPPDLVRPCVLAGTSPKACEICGAPWERVVKAEGGMIGESWHDHSDDNGKGITQTKGGISKSTLMNRADKANPYHRDTLGWQPTCSHANEGTGRSIVLDPFSGTGTVGMVAGEYGRDFVGLDLSMEYMPLALERTRQARAQMTMEMG